MDVKDKTLLSAAAAALSNNFKRPRFALNVSQNLKLSGNLPLKKRRYRWPP